MITDINILVVFTPNSNSIGPVSTRNSIGLGEYQTLYTATCDIVSSVSFS